MTNLDLFLPPLVVGGIAALTLTGNAFERPNKLKKKYLDEVGMQKIENIKNASNDFIPNYWFQNNEAKSNVLFQKKVFGIYIFDIIEAVVMSLYLIVELLVLCIFIYPNPIEAIKDATCYKDDTLLYPISSLLKEQIELLFIGYGILWLGLLITLILFIYCLYAISRQKRRKRITNHIEFDDANPIEFDDTRLDELDDVNPIEFDDARLDELDYPKVDEDDYISLDELDDVNPIEFDDARLDELDYPKVDEDDYISLDELDDANPIEFDDTRLDELDDAKN